MEKRRFLIAYDYGMGGLWGVMAARSEAEIVRRYPELAIVETRPAWMSTADLERMQEECVDIDDEPSGLLEAVVADRNK